MALPEMFLILKLEELGNYRGDVLNRERYSFSVVFCTLFSIRRFHENITTSQ